MADGDDLDGLDRVGIRRLRNEVSGLVQRAAAGERIIVTVDGRPMAQLGPLGSVEVPTLDDLAAAGLVDAPRRAGELDPVAPVSVPADVRLDHLVDRVRGRP